MGKYQLNKMKLAVYIIYATILMQLLAFGLASTNAEVVSRRDDDYEQAPSQEEDEPQKDTSSHYAEEEDEDEGEDEDEDEEEDEEEDEAFAFLKKFKNIVGNLKKLSLADVKKKVTELKKKMKKLSGKKLKEVQDAAKKAAAALKKKFPKQAFFKWRENTKKT